MIALLSLDDRPCNTLFPAQIAAIGGDDLIYPPRAILGRFNWPADTAALQNWLDGLPEVEALIVSVDVLAYGGLVASRKTATSAETALSRLQALQKWREARPATPIYAFNVLMRLAITMDSDAAVPHYYNVMRYARLVDEAAREPELAAELAEVTALIPPAILAEYHGARARNHAVNLEMVEWLSRGTFDYLLVTQEDCTQFGLHRREQAKILERVQSLGVGERFALHPGADEAALTLLARHWKTGISFGITWSDEARKRDIAVFEDVPYEDALRSHIAAMGGKIAAANAETNPSDAGTDSLGPRTDLSGPETNLSGTRTNLSGPGTDLSGPRTNLSGSGTNLSGPRTRAEGDFALFVNAPVGGSQKDENGAEKSAREADLGAFCDAIEAALGRNQPVALCDVAFPNGADETLLSLLEERELLGQLAVFGGWNTAGNTTGTVLAQCAALFRAGDETSQLLNRQFVFERLVDDWGYQSRVRAELERVARTRGFSPINMNGQARGIEILASEQLTDFARQIAPQFGARVEELQVALPWGRTFEVEVGAKLS